jgi:hypothetical protein
LKTNHLATLVHINSFLKNRIARKSSFQLCTKMCSISDVICWFCSGLFVSTEASKAAEDAGGQEPTAPIQYTLPTTGDLIEKAKSHFRRQKDVPGVPVKPGDLPYVVRQVLGPMLLSVVILHY